MADRMQLCVLATRVGSGMSSASEAELVSQTVDNTLTANKVFVSFDDPRPSLLSTCVLLLLFQILIRTSIGSDLRVVSRHVSLKSYLSI